MSATNPGRDRRPYTDMRSREQRQLAAGHTVEDRIGRKTAASSPPAVVPPAGETAPPEARVFEEIPVEERIPDDGSRLDGADPQYPQKKRQRQAGIPRWPL